MPFNPQFNPRPVGRHGYSYRRIQQVRVTVEAPDEWENPHAKLIAERDQNNRGTCCGQAGGEVADIVHVRLTGQVPTDADRALLKKDVTDVTGCVHDILFPWSASAEGLYQKSREYGGITGDEDGSDTRYIAKAWIDYGYVPETAWHTDKVGNVVWKEPVETTDGGLSPEACAKFAANHRAEGWAMVGNSDGIASFSELCQAIYEKGCVLAAIPVFDNYHEVADNNGFFPEPPANPWSHVAGWHALCFYGYSKTKGTIKLLHSWGSFCNTYGGLSKDYFDITAPESVYLVILDSQDTAIAKETYAKLAISAKDSITGEALPASIYVDGTFAGYAPLKVAIEVGKTVTVEARYTGYQSQKKSVNDGGESVFTLEPDPATRKTPWQIIIDVFLKFIKSFW